jgi:hypothetical protein
LDLEAILIKANRVFMRTSNNAAEQVYEGARQRAAKELEVDEDGKKGKHKQSLSTEQKESLF